MFGMDYVLLSGEDLNSIVVWLLRLKEKFEDNNGIACIREIYDECVGKQESELNKPPVVSMLQQVPDIKMFVILLMKLFQRSRIFWCHQNRK